MKNEPFVLDSHPFLTVEPFKNLDDRLIVGFSTRTKGYSIESYHSLNLALHVQDEDSTVIANRIKLANDLQFPLHKWVFSEQIHGNNIKKISQKDCGRGTLDVGSAVVGCDGLFTTEKNILLASLYADCVPLYFYSTTKRIIGLAHAGWKGTVAKIGPKMVQKWIDEEEIPLNSIYVAIGPAISQESYEVDDHVISKVIEILPEDSRMPFKKSSRGKYLLDLKELNVQLLLNIGVKRDHIFKSNYCTHLEKDLFYSYRRNQQTGRMMSFIGRT